MEEIKKRMLFFIVMSCLMFLFSIMANEPSRWIGGLIVLVFVVLSIYEYKKFRLAKLIVDNNIAFIENICIKNTHRIEKETKRIGVYISCFGAMIESQIIEDNRDGIIVKINDINNSNISLNREINDNEIIVIASYENLAKND